MLNCRLTVLSTKLTQHSRCERDSTFIPEAMHCKCNKKLCREYLPIVPITAAQWCCSDVIAGAK